MFHATPPRPVHRRLLPPLSHTPPHNTTPIPPHFFFFFHPCLATAVIRTQELCRTAWALGRLGLGGIFGSGSVLDVGGGGGRAGDGDSEDEGSAMDGGGEMSGLMDKVLGECSKWLEIFTPQVLHSPHVFIFYTILFYTIRVHVQTIQAHVHTAASRREDFSGCVWDVCG